MKSQLNWQDYQALELIPSSHGKASLGSKLNDTWQTILAYFAASSEPHVWLSQNASGLSQWKAYDPMTGKTVAYDSETEMRVWLEERHYQYQPWIR